MTAWTTGAGQPLGALLSFGSSATTPSAGDRLIFSGTGAVSADADNTAPQVMVAGQDAMEILASQRFAIDKTGFSAMPFKDSIVTWIYYLAATAGLPEAQLWQDLEYRLHLLYAWYWGTYTYSNSTGSITYAGASGQKGDIQVADASGAPRKARAVWLSFPIKPVPGQVAYYEVELTFRLLSQWV